MDNTFEITVSAQAARNLIPCLENTLEGIDEVISTKYGEIAQTQVEIESLKAQKESTKITLAELKAKLEAQKPVIKDGKLQQRLPKGYGAKLIEELLRTLPIGQGLTMGEIEEKTGINHATVYRTLTRPWKEGGIFASKRGKWMLHWMHRAKADVSLETVANGSRQPVPADKCCSGPMRFTESQDEKKTEQ